jgi:hypothetical protein
VDVNPPIARPVDQTLLHLVCGQASLSRTHRHGVGKCVFQRAMSHLSLDGLLSLRHSRRKTMVAVREHKPFLRLEHDNRRDPVDGASVQIDLEGIEVALLILRQSSD